jgi:nucleoside phosphorylase
VIAVLVATQVEAQRLLRHMAAVKSKGIFHYRGKFADKPAAFFLTHPGVRSIEQVRRFLRLYDTDLVVSTGTCSSLTSNLRLLQPVLVGSVTNADCDWLQLQNAGVKCVSVRRAVRSDAERALLRERTGAEILDRETWSVAKIMSEAEFALRRFVAVRIVGVLPGEENWLNKEQQLRDLSARRPSGRLKPAEIVRFGIWDFFSIQARRRRVALAIERAVAALAAGKPVC